MRSYRHFLVWLPIAFVACAHAATDRTPQSPTNADELAPVSSSAPPHGEVRSLNDSLTASLTLTNAKIGNSPRVGDGDSLLPDTNADAPSAIAAPNANAGGDSENPSACPSGMVLVDGEYCPNVEQTCLRYRDKPGNKFSYFRCDEYQKPAKCAGKRVHKRFCIDEREHLEPGTDLPYNKKSWTQSKNICEAEGARLCMTSEWQFACEGEEMRPYPYGWERDSEACNVDIEHGLGMVGHLVDHRTPASAHPRCVSPFGVHDMAGNVDEWATIDGAPVGKREIMKGSWWLPGRHACRQGQGGHGANYGGTESGVRCCKDANVTEESGR